MKLTVISLTHLLWKHQLCLNQENIANKHITKENLHYVQIQNLHNRCHKEKKSSYYIPQREKVFIVHTTTLRKSSYSYHKFHCRYHRENFIVKIPQMENSSIDTREQIFIDTTLQISQGQSSKLLHYTADNQSRPYINSKNLQDKLHYMITASVDVTCEQH